MSGLDLTTKETMSKARKTDYMNAYLQKKGSGSVILVLPTLLIKYEKGY